MWYRFYYLFIFEQTLTSISLRDRKAQAQSQKNNLCLFIKIRVYLDFFFVHKSFVILNINIYERYNRLKNYIVLGIHSKQKKLKN